MGAFAGKFVFASTGVGERRYLTASTWRGGAAPVSLPAMAAASAGATERCVLYGSPDGSTRVQLGNGSWIGLREDLGWLILVETEAAAVPLVLSADPLGALGTTGATWQARTADGKLATVSYTTDGVDPLLTINGVGASVFDPSVTTPSLAAIVAAHGCPGADLSGVSLKGTGLTGLDLTRADLTRADLAGCRFTDAVLERTVFTRATLTGAMFDGADLSHADFTATDLDGLAWGRPKRAPGLVLTGCSARGAKLGSDQVLDCSGAALSTADFTGADLSHWNLTGADLSGATAGRAVLDHVTLDGARLRNLVAPGASFRFATLRGCDAQGADLAHADLSFADLTRVRMGSRAYLFGVAASYAAQLDKALYVPAELVAEFRQHGITVSDQDPVNTELPGKAWSIVDSTGTYRLALSPEDNRSTSSSQAPTWCRPAWPARAARRRSAREPRWAVPICAESAGTAAAPPSTTPTSAVPRWSVPCSSRPTSPRRTWTVPTSVKPSSSSPCCAGVSCTRAPTVGPPRSTARCCRGPTSPGRR